MDVKKFKQILYDNEEKLVAFRKKKIFLISDCINGGLLVDKALIEKNAAQFSDETAEAFKTLIYSDFLNDYLHPVMVNFRKTVDVYTNSDLAEEERIKTAFLISRVNFMGTDGIRGKVVLETKENCIVDLLSSNAFTPDLVETTSFSFAKMLLKKGVLSENDTIVIGNDGRDKAYDWRLNAAVIDGFNRAKLQVLDLGTIPTALVPYTMLQKGYKGAAMLTASHNPANQNGIKFFIDGKKLLPEGAYGDYVLSAYMYNYCVLESLPDKCGTATKAENVGDEGKKFILSVLPENISEILKDTVLVFDSANGAFTDIGKKVLDTLGVAYSTVNEEPTGVNINRSCGVAEIEGIELFEGADYDSYIPFIKEMFNKGRSNDAGKVYGIALDGDGDRGFLLYYNIKKDCIHVIDGDKCGYILSEYFIKTKNLNPKDYYFVSTIESDLMTATNAQKVLGLNTKIVSVGDKWICNFNEGQLIVGLEISGHLIFPITFKNVSGKDVTLLSGVGLLTGLMTLTAIKQLNLPAAKIIEPFKPGVSKTFYVFFVDKSRFYRNSNVWIKDSELVKSEVERLKNEGKLSADIELVFEDKEDLNVLYINIVNKEGIQGCIFMRNSGTEEKTATYVKGKSEIKDALFELGQEIQDNHTELMKNENRVEYKYETFILSVLKEKGDINFGEIKNVLEKETQSSINEGDLFSVVYGLKKEGRITFENQIVKVV